MASAIESGRLPSPGLGSSRLRLAMLGASLLIVALAVSGVLAEAVFRQPTTLKYLVTVLGALLLVAVAMSPAPLKLLVGVAILVAPFDFVTSAGGFAVTPLLAVDVLALLVWVPQAETGAGSAVRLATVAFVALLVPAVAGSDAPLTWLLWLAVTVVTGCLVFIVAREPGGARFIAAMIAASAFIQALLALWEWRTGQRLNLYLASGSVPVGSQYFFLYGHANRPSGALPDPIGLGQVLALCIPIMVALAAATRRWLMSLAVLGAMGAAGVALLLSLDRMSMIGGAAGLVLAVLLLPRKELLRTGTAVVAIVVAVAVIGLAAGGQALRQRIDSIMHPTAAHVSTASGDLTRERIWAAALKTAEANPVAGVGLGNVTQYLPRYGVPVTSSSHSHDTYLQLFAEGGTLGLVALLGLIGAAFVDLRRALATSRVWVAGAAGALVATLLTWVTDVEVRYVQVSAMVAVLLGLIAALAARRVRVRAPVGAAARLPSLRLPTPVAIAPAAVDGVLALRPVPQSAPRVHAPRIPSAPATSDAAAPAGARSAIGELPPAGANAALDSSLPRLAILIPSREDGGAEQYVRVIAQAARARGWVAHAACPMLPGTARLVSDLAAAGVVCHPLRIPLKAPRGRAQALRFGLSEAVRTARMLRRARPTTILSVLPHPDQAPGMALATALWPSASVVSVQLVPPGLRFTAARRRLYRVCGRLGQQWITLSGDNQRRLAGALGRHAVSLSVIPNGVDDLAPAEQDRRGLRERVRAELGVEPDAKLIVTVGRLNAQKGYDLIADSIPGVVGGHPHAVWAWIGEGALRGSLTERLDRNGARGHVRLLGVRADVPQLLAAGDLFVLPSRYEASPFALLEALACGLPVVVSDAGSLPEIVRDEVDGLVVGVDSIEALAIATTRALDSPGEMQALAASGRRRVLSEFGRERMTRTTLELLAPGTAELVISRARHGTPISIVAPRDAR